MSYKTKLSFSFFKDNFWFLLCIFRLWLGIQMPRYIYGNLPEDDMLHINLAYNLLRGQWFGEYSSAVLNKSPGYTFFLTLPSITGIPYSFLCEMAYIAAVLLSAKAFENFLNSKFKKYMWICVLLFNPISFDTGIAYRVYRNALIPTAVLLVLSSVSGLYLQRDKRNSNLLKWAIIAGISIFFFKIIREDSIWLFPFIIGAEVCLIVENWSTIRKTKDYLKIVILCLPIIISCFSTGILKGINYIHYGVWAITDFNETAFADVMSDIISVKPQQEKPYIWVTHETLNNLYETSPTLAELKPYIENTYNGGRQTWGKLGDDGEIEKDYIIWAFRDALKEAGLYQDSNSLNNKLSQIHSEISEGFKSGQLSKREGLTISSLAKPLSLKNSNRWFECAFESILYTNKYSKCSVEGIYSSRPYENVRLAEEIIRQPLILPNEKTLSIKGWGLAKNTADTMELYIGYEDESIEQHKLKFKESQDVYRYFKGLNMEYENALKARFNENITLSADEPLFLYCYINEKIHTIKPLQEIKNSGYEDDSFQIWVDEYDLYEKDIMILENKFSKFVFNSCLFIWQKCGLYLSIISVITFSILNIESILYHRFLRNFKLRASLLIGWGLVASYLALHLGVAFNYYEAWNRDGRHFYLGAAYIIQQIFVSLTLITFFEMRKRRNTNETNHPNPLL